MAQKIDEHTPRDQPILVWWPIVLVEPMSGRLTDREVDGAWLVTEWNGGHWLEPEVLNSLNSNPNSFGDDREYAEEPTHWRWLPAPITKPMSDDEIEARWPAEVQP